MEEEIVHSPHKSHTKVSWNLKKKFNINHIPKLSDLIVTMDKIYSTERETCYKEIENKFLRTQQENNLPKNLTLMRTPQPNSYQITKSSQSRRISSEEPRKRSRTFAGRQPSRGVTMVTAPNAFESIKISRTATPRTTLESRDYIIKSGHLFDKFDMNQLPYYYLNKLRKWNEKDKCFENSRSLSPTDRRKLNKNMINQRNVQCNALSELTEICEHFQPSKDVIGQIKQEKKILSWYSKRMSWTQETLRNMEQYDHTIIQPLYDHYRSVLNEFEKEANDLSKIYKLSGSDGSKLIGKSKRTSHKKKPQQFL